MGILQDMDAEFTARRPLPPGATWLVGGNVWHALMADLTRLYRDHPWPPFNPAEPPEAIYGAALRRVHRMSGWGLAEPLDAELVKPQECEQLELTPHVSK